MTGNRIVFKLGELPKTPGELLMSWHGGFVTSWAIHLDAGYHRSHTAVADRAAKAKIERRTPLPILRSSRIGVQRWKVGFSITEVVAVRHFTCSVLSALPKNNLRLNHAGRVVLIKRG
jgi:hypothetical protein